MLVGACGGGGDDGKVLMQRLRSNGYAADHPQLDHDEALHLGKELCGNASPTGIASYLRFNGDVDDEGRFVATAIHLLCPSHDDDVSEGLQIARR